MELVVQNPWWKNKSEIDKDIHVSRWLNSRVKWVPALKDEIDWVDAVYTVRGPRQVGKTTLLKLWIRELLSKVSSERIFYWSCDLVKDEQALYDIVSEYLAWARKLSDDRLYVFLDEVSGVRDWQKAVKLLWDTSLIANVTVILTGSHSLDIRASSERLPGRRGDTEKDPDKVLLPLSFSDYVSVVDPVLWENCRNRDKAGVFVRDLNHHLKTYLLTGGFPKAIDEYLREKKIGYSTYRAYLDVVLGDLEKWGKKISTTKDIIKVVIDSLTTPVGWSTIKNKTSVDSHNTVLSYIDALSESYTLFYIYQLDEKLLPMHKKNKKIYFTDPLLFHCLNSWSLGTEGFDEALDYLSKTDNESKLVENIVAINLFECYKGNEGFGFWGDKKEIDFASREKTWIEVKWKEKIKDAEVAGLKGVDGKKIVLTKNEYRDVDGISLIPVSLFLAWGGVSSLTKKARA